MSISHLFSMKLENNGQCFFATDNPNTTFRRTGDTKSQMFLILYMYTSSLGSDLDSRGKGCGVPT